MDVEKFFQNSRFLIKSGKLEFHPSNDTGNFIVLCSRVLQLPYKNRCIFIKDTQECHAAVQYFDYLNFIFCNIGSLGEYFYVGGVVLMVILCLYLFTVLATTADKFFCPTLAVISKLLKMSENLAGVTLLAFGNGSPDIFASLSNISGDTELVYCELIGAANFVTGFIAGAIILIRPFRIIGRNYIRDVMFFLFAVVLIDSFMDDENYTITEGICTVMIYVVYLCFVVYQHFQMKKEAQKIREMPITAENVSNASVAGILKKAEQLEDATEIKIYSRKDSSVIMDEDILKVFQAVFRAIDPNEGLFSTFAKSINPFDKKNWDDAGCIGKVLMILKAPVVFFLVLIIPTVDYSEYHHGWSKLLNMLNIVTFPQLFLFITRNIELKFFGYLPLPLIVLFVSLVASFVVYLTSRNDCPPKYHAIFAVGSFIGCVSVIYVTAKEVVAVMKAIGIISNRSDSYVGLLFLAIGNSIGDLFSNISLARQGYQHMAFAACFGGPMFNSLLGVGITFILKAIYSKDGMAHVREGDLGPNCIIFLILILFFPFLALSFTDFYARKYIGIYMIIIYSLFVLYSTLGEFHIMHPYGTDHHKT